MQLKKETFIKNMNAENIQGDGIKAENVATSIIFQMELLMKCNILEIITTWCARYCKNHLVQAFEFNTCIIFSWNNLLSLWLITYWFFCLSAIENWPD